MAFFCWLRWIRIGKVIIFRGNFASLRPDFCAFREFEYIPGLNRWKISDTTAYDWMQEPFCKRFEKWEIEMDTQFSNILNADGHIMDQYWNIIEKDLNQEK